jgi:hypothetical protein
VENEEVMYNVLSTLDTRCKKQEIRLSSVDIKILPTEQDSIYLGCLPQAGFLYLGSFFSLMSNAERRLKNVEVGNRLL